VPCMHDALTVDDPGPDLRSANVDSDDERRGHGRGLP